MQSLHLIVYPSTHPHRHSSIHSCRHHTHSSIHAPTYPSMHPHRHSSVHSPLLHAHSSIHIAPTPHPRRPHTPPCRKCLVASPWPRSRCTCESAGCGVEVQWFSRCGARAQSWCCQESWRGGAVVVRRFRLYYYCLEVGRSIGRSVGRSVGRSFGLRYHITGGIGGSTPALAAACAAASRHRAARPATNRASISLSCQHSRASIHISL